MTDSVWSQVEALPLGVKVNHWSVLKGNSNGAFQVVEIDRSVALIQTGQGSHRRISRTDFENVAKLWDDYVVRRVTRGQVNEVTFNSTYILSLLHRLNG
jgi:hypothetical protein